jgi:ABC-2 type transport system ATP-binding protein
MSGLDPLGRREVRALIIELREQGRTIFFSSHILSDAEALCSRVAVVAGGRLAALGTLAELAEFEVRGWELVVANLTPQLLDRVRPNTTRVLKIGPDRYSLELSLAKPPDQILSELVAAGASVVSLNPLRSTLEDFFVQRVQAVGAGAREAGDARR